MKKLFISLLAIMAMVSCSESGETDNGGGNNNQGGGNTPTTPTITLSKSSVTFDEFADEEAISFSVTADWIAEIVNDRADGWLSVSPTSGKAGDATITIKANDNGTPDERSASVRIKAGSAQKTINVTQKQKDALTVTSSKFEVEAEGGEVQIEVKANINFEYVIDESAKDWVIYQSTRGMKTSTLIFKVAENDDTEKREAKITIKSGEFSEEVMIYQAGSEPSIVISQDEYVVSSNSETIAVEVKSNVDVTIEIPADAYWISENTTRATSTNTYRFDILPNDNYDQRSTEIKFTNKENNISEVVKITQAQKDAIVLAKDSYTVDGNGGQIQIEVGHNVDFDIEIECDWITNVDTRAFTSEMLTFNITANTTENNREGKIKFISKDKTITRIITVTQYVKKACEIYIEVSCDEETLHNGIANAFGSNVTSIKESGEGYLITLKAGFDEIPSYAFGSWLKHITIGDGVTSIGDYAFYRCANLESITIPDSVTSIGNHAFDKCGFTSITIPDSVTSIGDYVFYHCIYLTSITIPDSVTSIGNHAFDYCVKLKSITIPDSVTSIGNYAFCECESLTSITIPDSVTSIGSNPFADILKLQAFYGKYASPDNRCLIVDGCLISFAQFGLTEYTIPDSVTSIRGSAFSNCNDLTSVTIGSSVTSIAEYAFYKCSDLDYIYFMSTTPPKIDPKSFIIKINSDYQIIFDATIYVPAGALAKYKESFPERYRPWLKGYYF